MLIHRSSPSPQGPKRTKDRLLHRRSSRSRITKGVPLDREHIGSTSVQDLPAKPVVDIDSTVVHSSDEAAYVPALERVGLVHTGRLTAPSTPGTYDVVADGLDRTVQPATLTVAAELGTTEQPLPNTGPDDAARIALIGGALLAAGVALLRLARLRPRRVN